YEAYNGGMIIGWTGSAKKYQVQKTESLDQNAGGLIKWENIGEPQDNAPVNFYVEQNVSGNSAYFRIKPVE
ncbi:MAG: hypothetical protein VX961_04300, partial [Verrucomicrobiota bacterium]|nr:hypothetical protein [Verrucomicrobiota bacterium]